MKSRICILLLSCFVELSSTQCDCRSNESLKKSHEHLRLIVKITAMKLMPTVTHLIAHSEAEKLYHLERTRYEVIRDLQNTYGKLITHTDFQKHFEQFIGDVRTMMNDDSLQLREINIALNTSLSHAFAQLLPSTFLCLSMGECVSAPPDYVECMKMHAHHWAQQFIKEQEKISRRLAESLERYRHLDSRLIEIHQLLQKAETTITNECASEYTNVTSCAKCAAEGVGYCRESCQAAATKCYQKLSTDFDAHVHALALLVEDFEDGFSVLERGMHTAIRRLVEVQAPHLAKAVVNACGALGSNSPATKASVVENKPPRNMPKVTMKLADQLIFYKGIWKKTAVKVCAESSAENFCWNGTNIVSHTTAVEDGELPAILKDVRPRPRDPRIEQIEAIEGSADMSWSDDEDLNVNGSGSGLPPEDIFEVPTHVVEKTYTTRYPILPTTYFNDRIPPIQDVQDDVIISTGPEAPDSCRSLTLLTSLLLTLLIL